MEYATAAAADAARTDDASVIYEAFEFQDASETMEKQNGDDEDGSHADPSTVTASAMTTGTGHDVLSRLNSLPDPFASSSSSHSSDTAAGKPPAGLAHASTRSTDASYAPYSSGEVSSNLSRRGHHASSSDPFMISSDGHEGREGQAQGHGGGSHNNSAAGSVLVDGPARHAAAEPPESM